MRKYILLIILFLIATSYAVTTVYTNGTSGGGGPYDGVMYCYTYDYSGTAGSNVDDFTEAFTIGNCIIDRVVVDANGTDTSFKLYLYETNTLHNDVLIWSKTDLTTASVPYSIATVVSDGTGNQPGIPSCGELSLTLADGDDATMGDLEVFIYYRRR